jgi:hypothetical protein
MLCPVRWRTASNWLIVMTAAVPLTETEKDKLIDSDGFPDWDYMPGEDGEPFEYKASDWGWIEGRLVALDYSTPAFDTPAEHAALMDEACCDWTLAALTSHRPDDASRARMLAGSLRGSATAGCKSPRVSKKSTDYGNNSWISNLDSLT